jgi:hypothetical protein
MTKACLKRQARISSFILAVVIINSNDLSDSPFHDAYLASVAACFDNYSVILDLCNK